MSKKIAIIASYIHPIRQKHLLDWYEDISFKNLKTQLFLGSKNKSIPLAINYKLNSKKEKLKNWFSNLFDFTQKTDELKRIQPLTRYNPDIIHLLTSNAFQNIEPILENKNIKLIVSFRGFDVNVFPNLAKQNRILIQRIFKRADVLHFISEDLKNTAIGLGADPRKSIVLYRSIRAKLEENFTHSPFENRRLIILSVGRLVWEKGFLYALETISILKKKGYEFEYQIAGEGIDYNMLVFHLERLNIRDRVNLLGGLSEEEVKERLIQADIYFQPSLTEALSMAIIEASYYNLPVVSSYVGGIPEVVENNVTGLLSDSCNPEEYAKNFVRLFEDREMRIGMGNSAHSRMVKIFSREKEIEEWKKIYGNL